MSASVQMCQKKGFSFAVREGCRQLASEVGRVLERTRFKRSSRSIRAHDENHVFCFQFIRRIFASGFRAGFVLSFRWIPSELNCSDEGSRLCIWMVVQFILDPIFMCLL